MTKTETWRQRVTAWRASGLTAAKFCAGEGIHPSSLYGWSRRLQQHEAARRTRRAVDAVPDEGRSEELPRLVRLVRAAPAAGSPIEIVVGGVTVAVRAGFDASMLRDVLSVLEARVHGSAP